MGTYRLVLGDKDDLHLVAEDGLLGAGGQVLAVPNGDGLVVWHVDPSLCRKEPPDLILRAKLGREGLRVDLLIHSPSVHVLIHWRVKSKNR